MYFLVARVVYDDFVFPPIKDVLLIIFSYYQTVEWAMLMRLTTARAVMDRETHVVHD